jgi:myo-inositol-1(or 4)-monophosphatase
MTWSAELACAVKAARDAGAFLRDSMEDRQTVLANEGRDIKIQADRDAEARILETLSECGHPVLAEESGEHGLIEGTEPYWVVDPLDGTMNYLRGLPTCCVSIALCTGAEPLLGVIYDFNHDECFEATVDGGARCNDRDIAVSAVRDPKQAVLSTGVPSGMSLESDALDRFVTKIKAYKKVRMIGSAAMSLALVANGRMDVYSEESIYFWDVAAGIALVRAAGGAVRMTPSDRSKWAVDVWAGCDECMWEHLDL